MAKGLDYFSKWAIEEVERTGLFSRAYPHETDATSGFKKAIEIDPNNASAYNNPSWLLATADSSDFRNGKNALEFALKACELSNWKNSLHLDTLAAAYARAGDFENAVKWQKKTLEMMEMMKSDEMERKREAEKRLDIYRNHKPWPPN